jgi:hypothetical protein
VACRASRRGEVVAIHGARPKVIHRPSLAVGSRRGRRRRSCLRNHESSTWEAPVRRTGPSLASKVRYRRDPRAPPPARWAEVPWSRCGVNSSSGYPDTSDHICSGAHRPSPPRQQVTQPLPFVPRSTQPATLPPTANVEPLQSIGNGCRVSRDTTFLHNTIPERHQEL